MMPDIWKTVHQERAALAENLSSLSASEWEQPSLCTGWSIHDVLAHLVDDAKTTKVGFVIDLIRARFDFDRANQQGVTRERRGSPAETLAAFRDVSNRATSAPAPLATRLVEIIVHGEDIRRPAGISHAYPTDAVIEAMKYQVGASASMGGSKERVAGLQLVATDADFSYGAGAEVRGPALALLLAITGRKSALEELVGDGVGIIQTR